MDETLLEMTEAGIYVPAGDFYIDPCKPVADAVVTHAHADHCRSGMERYHCSEHCGPLLRQRVGNVDCRTYRYGEEFSFNDVTVSLHPAGHIRGSAQVRVAFKDRVTVVTGDYKRADDRTCAAFEPVECDTLVTEATFGLPIYSWPSTGDVVERIVSWWKMNQERGYASVLLCYSLGKTQRVLAELVEHTDETVYLHGAAVPLTELYREEGIEMVPTEKATTADVDWSGKLVIAPTSAYRSKWMRRFDPCEVGFASGWMRVRGAKRQRGYERGFVLSDHCDWDGLLATIDETGASQVLVTHGDNETFARYVRGQGVDAAPLETLYEGKE